MVERYYEKLQEIREAVDAVTANNLLHEGYELLAIRNRTIFEDDREKSYIVYIFGKFTAEEKATEQTTDEGYESIDWHQGKDFQWTFHTDKQGKEIAETHMLAQKINESENGCFRQDGWEYRMSKDGRFITRRRIQGIVASDKSLIEIAMETFKELHGPDKKPVARDSFLDALEKTNKFNRDEAKKMVNHLYKMGVIYEIRPGFYSTI